MDDLSSDNNEILLNAWLKAAFIFMDHFLHSETTPLWWWYSR